MGIAEFVAGVDRLLSRTHDLFPKSGASEQLPASVTGGSVPAAPLSASGLRSGVSGVAASYQRAQVRAVGLDEQVRLAAVEAGACGQQGRVASGIIRDQARLVGAAAGPMASLPAGVRLIVATLDQHLAAMQSQLESTRVSTRWRRRHCGRRPRIIGALLEKGLELMRYRWVRTRLRIRVSRAGWSVILDTCRG